MRRQMRSQSGGIATILVVAVLLAVVAGLYLQLVMKESPPKTAMQTSGSAVSVQVLEGDEPALSEPAVTDVAKPLPDDQMAMILRVFAPETGD